MWCRGLSKAPERLHTGLDYMIEQERPYANSAGDPTIESEDGQKRPPKRVANAPDIRRWPPKG
jgi:hypothetical protein